VPESTAKGQIQGFTQRHRSDTLIVEQADDAATSLNQPPNHATDCSGSLERAQHLRAEIEFFPALMPVLLVDIGHRAANADHASAPLQLTVTHAQVNIKPLWDKTP
jgi:hypothetical protein